MSGTKFRSDVVAVGQVSFGTDVFLIGAVLTGDPSYHLLVYDTVNRIYVYLEGAIGSLVSSTAALPTGYQLHYFQASQGAATYPQSMYHVVLTPFLDAAATQAVSPGTVVFPQVSSAGVCQLTLATPPAAWPGLMLDTTDPVELPSTGNPMLGYKYLFYASNLQTGKLPVQASTPVYKGQSILSDDTYGGLPFGIASPPVPEAANYTAVFLPLNWWVGPGPTSSSVQVLTSSSGSCSAQISTDADFNNVLYSVCDRFGALAPNGTQTAFYTSNCANINDVRGNIRASDCIITGGAMYYLPDGFSGSTTVPAVAAPSRCGVGWANSTTFRDLTDVSVSGVGNPYGGCNSSQSTDADVCQFSSNGVAACAPLQTGGSTPPPDCPDTDPNSCSTSCESCPTSACPNDCTQCTVNCDGTGSSPPCNIQTSPSTLMWVIIAILAIIAIGLFLMIMHDGTKTKKEKQYADKYDAGSKTASSKTTSKESASTGEPA